jgi:hypothetical protein
VNDLKIAFRAPWYERERDGVTVNDTRSLRPVLQKYDDTSFVQRLVADPQDSLEFTDDDLWSYPVPVTFPAPGTGRQRFATSRLVRTQLRKLYQPSHDRFYAVVVELFCDAPGLPRAGKHNDVTVQFVVRRRDTTIRGSHAQVKKLARVLMLNLLQAEGQGLMFDGVQTSDTPEVKKLKRGRIADREDLWWGDELARQRFEEDKKDLLHAVTAHTSNQIWLTNPKTGKGRWADLNAKPGDGEIEQTIPMWRLPPEQCDPDGTRSLWFGLVPTYSADHWNDPTQSNHSVPKFDERAIYEIVCIATQKPQPGHEHCPPKTWDSVASEPFRLAAPYDPDGTKNHRVSISAPDLRRLAARAGLPAGPGGLSISTPRGSQFKFNPFDSSFPSVSGSLGAGGGACTFAFELFFLVALFLFLMFLPIIVFAFQLWWLLALRFCFPRLDVTMSALANFFASVGAKTMADLDANAEANLDLVLGDGMGAQLKKAASTASPPESNFLKDNAMAQAFVGMIDPQDAVTSAADKPLPQVPDPLCEKK